MPEKPVSKAFEERSDSLGLDFEDGIVKPKFDEIFDISDVQKAQDLFSLATGIASVITTLDGKIITQTSNCCKLCNDIIRKNQKGLSECFLSNPSKLILENEETIFSGCKCYGLLEARASINVNGIAVANWFIGPIRDKNVDDEIFVDFAKRLGVSENAFFKELKEIKAMGIEQFKAITNLLIAKANQISKDALKKIQQESLVLKQKNTEREIKRNQELQSKMIANIGDVIVIIGRDGIVKYKSPNIEKWFGWKVKEIVGKSVWYNIHPDDLDFAKAFIKSLLEKESSIGSAECRYRCKDGTYKWIEFTGNNLLHDPDINGILGNYHQITERKNAEKMLLESETRFKALHNASFGGIAIHDKGVILECNNGLAEMSGYSFEELIGMDGLKLIAEKARPLVLEKILSGDEKPYEAIGLRKNGEEYPIRLEARNVPYKGKMVRTVEFRDITEGKLAEKERDRLQSQLIQAQRLESIGRLAGGVAHDFNNMLTVIIGYTQASLDEIDENSPIHDSLIEILKAAERSADITAQLLAFARKQTISPKVVNLNEAVENILQMLRRLIGEDIALIWKPTNSTCLVKIDPSQIDQILANLCVNSKDAIDGIGKIEIETKIINFDLEFCSQNEGYKPGDYVCISIADNGSGMDQDTLKNSLEPFFTTKGVGKGTGLGLATVYGIVKQNEGFLKLESKIGEGTCLKIFLPAQKDAISNHLGNDFSDESFPEGTETILLVEDEPAILKMTNSMLEKQGYKIFASNNPLETINLVKSIKNKVDLLISDVVMPEMNGLELSKILRKQFPEMKILFVSGYTANIMENKGALEDGYHFLQKPFSKIEFQKKIREVIEDSNS